MTALATVVSANASTMFGLILEVALKGTLVMAIIGFAAFGLRRATASVRHLLWSSAIVAMLVIPALTLVLPRWHVGVISVPAPSNQLPASRSQLQAARLPLPPATSLPQFNAIDAIHETSVSNTVATSPSSLSVVDALALLWLGGVVAGLITIIGGLLTLGRVRRKSTTIAGAEWQSLIAELKSGLRITRDVRVLVSQSAVMPATWGVLRPMILLPAEAEKWEAERRRVVLLHELAHVRRNDCLMQLVAQICCAIYWFHPGVWYSARQLRVERELACDEHVLGVGINACDYAEHLLEIAIGFRATSGTAIAGVAMARSSQLEGRLLAILSEDLPSRWRVSRAVRIAAMITLAALTVPLAAMRPWRDAVTPGVFASISGSVPPISAAPDGFHWRGPVEAGKWVVIYSLNGDMRAELSNDGNVEVVAVTKSGNTRNLKFVADRFQGGMRFCAINSQTETGATRCQTTIREGLLNSSGEARLDYLVKIPRGVGIALHTSNGNITAESVQSYVWGTSDRGNIRITTTDLAEANTGVGSIYAQFGRRSWRQDLEFLAESGDVTVIAPSDASMMIEAETNLGRVRSAFPGEARPFGSGQQIFATTGARRGMLTLRTGRGDVDLRRGAKAVAELSDMPVSVAGAPFISVDPKPNPNPDPEVNPDPNPSPDVEAADTNLEGDDPTGERVPVKIPDGFVERFNDATIRNWRDARAIGRLRDIAATHVKQHPADLVRERSEWALSIVRNGEIVAPLREAMTNSDWRVRAYAAWALSETRDPGGADILTAALRDPHWRVRMHAASGLERLGNARAVDPLITALADEYWQVRISAVDALAAIGDRRALTSLRATAECDSRWIVRDQARNALGRIR